MTMYARGVGRHDCRPPLKERPIDDTTWTCPDCGDVWEVEALEPIDPAPRYRFTPGGGYAGPTHARWVRRVPYQVAIEAVTAADREADGTAAQDQLRKLPKLSIEPMPDGSLRCTVEVDAIDEWKAQDAATEVVRTAISAIDVEVRVLNWEALPDT